MPLPAEVRGKIISAVSRVEGVLEVDRVRIRRAGNKYFADLSVGLARNVTFQRAEQVADAVADAIHLVLPDADVVVHSIPRALRTENIFDRIRAVASRRNLNVHDVSVQDLSGHLHVEQHLELDERLSLKEAHDRVSVLETEIRSDVPEIASIVTHIESEPATIESGDEIVRDASPRKAPQGHRLKLPRGARHARCPHQARARAAVRFLPLHSFRRPAALSRARYFHRTRNPLQAGRARNSSAS